MALSDRSGNRQYIRSVAKREEGFLLGLWLREEEQAALVKRTIADRRQVKEEDADSLLCEAYEQGIRGEAFERVRRDLNEAIGDDLDRFEDTAVDGVDFGPYVD